MHPESIKHLDTSYDLNHLKLVKMSLNWVSVKNVPSEYPVWLRFSTHCYSETLSGPLPSGAYPVGESRVFSPERYARSLALPGLFDDLFSNPTKKVSRTKQKRNWSLFTLKMSPPMVPGSRYYMFFNLRKSSSGFSLEMFVESAYERDRPVLTDRSWPFGRVAERVLAGEKI